MFLKKFLAWLPMAVVITAMSGLVYLAVQQEIRLSANDPQIQISEDTAAELASGQSIQNLLSNNLLDINSSLAPFVIVYDKSGKVLGSTALLGNDIHVPSSVFGDIHGQMRFTWQPVAGARYAVVMTQVFGDRSGNVGYVLAGRSLREVEKREGLLEFQVGIVWLMTLFLTLAITVLRDSKHFK